MDSHTEVFQSSETLIWMERGTLSSGLRLLFPLLPLLCREAKNGYVGGQAAYRQGKPGEQENKNIFMDSTGEPLWVEIPPLIVDISMGEAYWECHLSQTMKQVGKYLGSWGYVINNAWQ